MYNRLEEFIAKEKLFTRKHRLLLAVSGGVDSVVLLFLLTKLGYNVSVAHMNFGLREAESEGDEKFVRQLCRRLDIELFVKRVETKNFAKQHKMGIQEAARKFRYDWFAVLTIEHKFDRLLTAHHATDSLETILLNLCRGTGPKGLEGIKPKTGKLVRPMLCFNAKEIREFAKKEKLKWREDSSNASDKYKRNFIRHQVIPQLLAINPNLEETIQSHQLLVSEVNEAVGSKISDCIQKNLQERQLSFQISRQIVNDFEFPLNLIKELTTKFGFGHATHADILLSCKSKTSKKFFSNTYEVRTGVQLLIRPIQESATFEKLIFKVPSFVEFADEILSLNYVKSEHKIFTKETNYLDAWLLSFPIKIRTWRNGDKFSPSGMKGKKKVSDFLTELKLSPSDKEKVLVIENDQEIACVVGMRVAEKYKLREDTIKILKISRVRREV